MREQRLQALQPCCQRKALVHCWVALQTPHTVAQQDHGTAHIVAFQMPHRYGYLDNTLIQIAGRIIRTTPECFKVFMTGEVRPCLKQYRPASHVLWECCEVRSLGAIQAARRLPD